MVGRKSWQAARRLGGALGVLSVLAASAGATGGQEGDIGGNARCGADNVGFPASAGHPDSWTDAQREEVRQFMEECCSADEMAVASAHDPALEERAAEPGPFVVGCADFFRSLEADEKWIFEHDSFMD